MFNGDISEINLIYYIDHLYTNIFDSHFISNNKDKCKMIIDNKEYEIKEYLDTKHNNSKLNIKLKGINNITDMSEIFSGCSTSDISKLSTNNIIDMRSMFDSCSSLSSLPDISN